MSAKNETRGPIQCSITNRSICHSRPSKGIEPATESASRNSTTPRPKIGFLSLGTSNLLETRLPVARPKIKHVSMQAKAYAEVSRTKTSNRVHSTSSANAQNPATKMLARTAVRLYVADGSREASLAVAKAFGLTMVARCRCHPTQPSRLDAERQQQRERANQHVGRGGQVNGSIYTKNPDEKIARQEAAGHRAKRIDGVQQADALTGPPSAVALLDGDRPQGTEHGQRAAHQKGRQQQDAHRDEKTHYIQQKEARLVRLVEPQIEPVHVQQNGRKREGVGPEAQFQIRVPSQGPAKAIGGPSQQPTPQGQSQHERGENGAGGKHRVPEDGPKGPHPDDLVDQAGRAGHEKQQNHRFADD